MEDINFERGFSSQEALDMAYFEDIDAIYVEPPKAKVLTDEDSADEDSGDTIDNLSGRQLRARAEVKFFKKGNGTAVPEEPDLPTSSISASISSYLPRSKKDYSWISGDLQAQKRDFPEPDFKQFMDLSPVQLFELVFDDAMITFLIEKSSRYALFKNLPDLRVSNNEMKCFIAILIVSGYAVLPGKKSYWESQGDVNNAIVSGAMRRDRGIDFMDENVSRYRIGIRSKKWWWPIFTWFVDFTVMNAWQIHRKSGGRLTQLEFRREITTCYLQSYGTIHKPVGRPRTSKTSLSLNKISDDVRYDGINHLVVETPDRKRCAGEGCSSSVRTMCHKCNLGLCISCFYIFHTK
ncbi:hypothetical protein NQ314_012637 [Rhamnusium bicolor]|uniref:PiggyBac transposable element-derived protein domain-containing protein n=1 Tax=Rhamnusium bicolor TaxID=1586634 RepID=A0AAV8X9Y4_9CUCU|nr:hypothetical protein NQ314_012637 [Rhamnusium bicolor]